MDGMTAMKMTAAGVSEFANTFNKATVARTKASAYRSQARMAMLQASQQTKYLNETLSGQVAQSYEQARQIIASQNASMTASGFTDVSTGDKRILADTIRRRDAQVDTANQNAYIQAFEINRQANMEYNRLMYAAKSQDAIAKNRSGLRGIALGLVNGGMALLGEYTPSATNDVSPTTTFSPSKAWDANFKNTTSKLDLGITPSVTSFMNF